MKKGDPVLVVFPQYTEWVVRPARVIDKLGKNIRVDFGYEDSSVRETHVFPPSDRKGAEDLASKKNETRVH